MKKVNLSLSKRLLSRHLGYGATAGRGLALKMTQSQAWWWDLRVRVYAPSWMLTMF